MKALNEKNTLLVFCFLIFSLGFSQSISPYFFGQNAWMPYAVGDTTACTDPPCIFKGKLDQHWQDVKTSGAVCVRYGGAAADKNMPTRVQYLAAIDSIRANGMEPIVQVPFCNFRYSAQQAADLVTFINSTSGRNVKYWSIGNEPDLAYAYSTSAQVANYIRPFASAMKAADPSIFIIGPECAWFNQGILDGLTTPGGPDDVTGKDASGKYYLDVISFHRYPFNGTQTRAQVISFINAPGNLQDNLVYLNSRIAACNTAHGRTGSSALKAALTEGNVCYKNSSADNLNGTGANSFIGGQFVAEMLGAGLKNGMEFMNVWSVVEGSGSIPYNIGYIDDASGNKQPSYYHYQLLAENFNGIYVAATTNQANVKAFGCRNGQQVCVMILNEDLSNFHYTVRLNTGSLTIPNALQVHLDAGIAQEYADVLPGQASVLLTFNLNGAITKKCEYSLSGQAMAKLPPQCTNYGLATSVAETAKPAENAASDMIIYPNPTTGHLTVSFDKRDTDEKLFEIQIFNGIGQEVYSARSEFPNDREEISLPESLADGVYFLRLKQAKDKFQTKKIVLQRK